MMTTDQRAELDAVMAKALKTRDACRYYSMSVSFKNTPEAEAMLNLAMWAAPLLTATIDAQAAEIARLREALAVIRAKDTRTEFFASASGKTQRRVAGPYAKIARAALTGAA